VSVVGPKPKRTWGRRPWEWLPTPYAGRIMVPSKADKNPPMKTFTPITLMIVPGPGRLYQLVRVELNTPVARGFATKEQARAWCAPHGGRGGRTPWSERTMNDEKGHATVMFSREELILLEVCLLLALNKGELDEDTTKDAQHLLQEIKVILGSDSASVADRIREKLRVALRD
jgi:hypothetical protein